MRRAAALAATRFTESRHRRRAGRPVGAGPSSSPPLVRDADRGAAGLHRVAGVGEVTAQIRRVVRVGDVRPAALVGVAAEVVEQLPAAVAADAALADRALVYVDDLGGRPAG